MSDIDYVSFLLHTITIREEMGSRDRKLEKRGEISYRSTTREEQMRYESEDTDRWIINLEANRKKDGKTQTMYVGVQGRRGFNNGWWCGGSELGWDEEGGPSTRKDKKWIKWI